MVMFDRAIIVLVLGILAQSLLRMLQQSGTGSGSWREDLEAEMRLMEVFAWQQQPAHGDGTTAGMADPLLAGALVNLRHRLELVQSRLLEHDVSLWRRIFPDASSFQSHTRWLRQWRQDWADRLPSADVGGGQDPAVEGQCMSEPSSEGKAGSCSVCQDASSLGASPAREQPAGQAEFKVSTTAPAPPQRLHVKAKAKAKAKVKEKAPSQASQAKPASFGEAGQGGDDGLDFKMMEPVLKEVVEMMHREPNNPEIVSRGCETLRYLAVDETSRVAIAAEDGVQIVLKAMKDNAETADVQGFCSGTLTHLAATAANRVAILKQKGLQVVLKGMRAHLGSTLVQYKGCAALANLAVSAAEQAKVAKIGGVRVAAAAIDVHLGDSNVVEHCLGALYNLASLNENRQGMLTAGAGKSVQKILKRTSSSPEALRLARKLAGILEVVA